MMKVAQNIAELIGDTPLVKLQRLQPDNAAAVYLKLESFNPSGSVKDRAAYNMIVEAERQGKLTKGATIIEPTSGNTGIGLAMNAAARGYKAILVMPDTMTKERINILKAYGAQVVLTYRRRKNLKAVFARQRNWRLKFLIALSRCNLIMGRTQMHIEAQRLLKSWKLSNNLESPLEPLSQQQELAEPLQAPERN